MRLTDHEKAMFDGEHGRAKARAMDLLVRYGEALGAERLIETTNVVGTWSAATPNLAPWAEKGFDAVFSKFNLDSDEVVPMPQAEVYTCQVIHGVDTQNWQIHGSAESVVKTQLAAEDYYGRRGISMMGTCTPYQVGNVPVKGEHCAWMESSAVVYVNGALGARTNTEGRESAGAASITGRIPYWGLHLDENRKGTHHIHIDIDVDDMMDWGLLGYWVGETVQEDIPVLDGIGKTPSMIKLKHFGAAAASSGGVEMYHVPGMTPEAHDLQAAFGGRAAREHLRYGAAERKLAYDMLNGDAKDDHVDFVMLGCPHNSIEQVWIAAKLLDGKRVHENSALWIFTPRAIKDIAERNGYGDIIRRAGAHLMSDTCPAIGRMMPKDTRVVATDSAKQAHYLPAIMGVQTWFGSVADCVQAALTGRWQGALR
jgi:predicted aconitase